MKKSLLDIQQEIRELDGKVNDISSVIATYVYGSRWSGSSLTEIKAPCAGTLFQFSNNGTIYGVIAHESDNKDSIKAWVIRRR